MPTLPIDHAGLEALPIQTCFELLASVPVGRLGFDHDGEVMIIPVNHVVDGQRIVFATGIGATLDAVENQIVVAFEVDSYDPGTRTGWSVLATGVVEPVDDDEAISRARSLGLHPWLDLGAMSSRVARIRPHSVTGRRIPYRAARESTADPTAG